MNTEIKDLLDLTHLNWGVAKEPIQTQSGILIPDKVALIRNDTNTVLSVMGSTYEPYQNEELLELLFKITQSTGLQLHTGGQFNGGARVFIQLKSDDFKLGHDTIKGFITGTNSFDGKTSLCFGNSNITISCMNTFFAASKQLDSQMKHSANLRPRIDSILQGIDSLLNMEKINFRHIKRLSETPLATDTKDTIIRTMFDIAKGERIQDLSTRKQNQIETFNADWASEIADKGDNLWGAFSAGTKYTTHHFNKNAERRDELKMFGASGQIDRTLWSTLLAA